MPLFLPAGLANSLVSARVNAVLLGLAGVLFSLVLSSTPVHASTPGYNGKIVFVSTRDGNSEIYTMNADGSNQINLTNNLSAEYDPSWSPDHSKIVFTSDRTGNAEVFTMSADGSNVMQISHSTSGYNQWVRFSPDGSQIAYISNRDGNWEVYKAPTQGGVETRLTTNAFTDAYPEWSPDGSKIAFQSQRDGNAEIYVMNADGSNQTRLTNTPASEFTPMWSPDGTKIGFESSRDGNSEIYVMNADGSNQTRLTVSPTLDDEWVSWSPDGAKIAVSSYNSDQTAGSLLIMNADGSHQNRLDFSQQGILIADYPVWSPDGTKIMFTGYHDAGWTADDVYQVDAEGANLTQLGSGGKSGYGRWQTLLNNAPITANDVLTTQSQITGAASVLTNDTDEELLTGTNLTISVAPIHGTASVDHTTGQIMYTSFSNYTGGDQLTYQICDSFLLDQKCATAVLAITVTAAPIAPTIIATPTPIHPVVTLASIGTLKTVAGETTYFYTGHRPTFAGTATAGATITVEIHSDPIILTKTTDANGSWSVTPNQDLPNGNHTVTITAAKDGVSTTLTSYTLGINTGLAETGMPLWPLPVVGLLILLCVRVFLRRATA